MEQIECAVKVLESVGALEALLKKPDANASEDAARMHNSLLAEYYILRTALVGFRLLLNSSRTDSSKQSWKQDRLDLAEHMYKKSTSCQQLLDPSTAESLADVLFEMGKDLLIKQQYENAVKWLERSYRVIGDQELDKMSTNTGELNLSVAESLIKANLALQTTDATNTAISLLETLEQTMTNRIAVYVMRLEIIAATTHEKFDSSSYGNILHRMTLSMMLSEPNFKLIMHHIRKLSEKNPSHACTALDNFTRLRLFSDVKEDWLEKIVITRVWMTVNYRDSTEDFASFETILSDISKVLEKPVNSAVTLAAHTVIPPMSEIESSR